MRHIYLTLLPLLFVGLFSSLSQAEVYDIAPDHKVYYRYQKADTGMPTVVLFNGLIYAVSYWDDFYSELSKSGVGVLQVAYSTQPESLELIETELAYFSKLSWTPFGLNQNNIETQTFVDEAVGIIDSLGIEKFSLFGLSYGSSVAAEIAVQQKDRVGHLILSSPAVVTSGRYNPYGYSRHGYYTSVKMLNEAATDYYYDAEIYASMSLTISPAVYSFEKVSFKNFFNGAYQMGRATKWFDLKEYAALELPDTYLFLATREEAELAKDQKRFWELMGSNPAQKAVVTFKGAHHALPGLYPKITAEETLKILLDQVTDSSYEVIVETENPSGTSGMNLSDTSTIGPQDSGSGQ